MYIILNLVRNKKDHITDEWNKSFDNKKELIKSRDIEKLQINWNNLHEELINLERESNVKFDKINFNNNFCSYNEEIEELDKILLKICNEYEKFKTTLKIIEEEKLGKIKIIKKLIGTLLIINLFFH